MPGRPLFIGMCGRALRPEKTGLPLRKMIRRVVWSLWKDMVRKERDTDVNMSPRCCLSRETYFVSYREKLWSGQFICM